MKNSCFITDLMLSWFSTGELLMRAEEKDLVDQVIRNSRRNYQMEKYKTIDTEMETLIILLQREKRKGVEKV